MQKYSAERIAEQLKEQGYDVRVAISRIGGLGWELLGRPATYNGPELWDPVGHAMPAYCRNGMIARLKGL